MEERPVAAVLILASVIALGHAAAAPLLADDRRRQDNRLSHFSSSPYLSHRSLQPRLHRFFSHPSPPPSSPSRPFRRWPPPARPQRPVGRGSKSVRRGGGGGVGGRKVNVGRKVGLLFVGVVVLLQVAFGVFLGVRRWQISKLERRSS